MHTAAEFPGIASGLAECLDRLAAGKGRNRPLATYRMQFHGGFRFRDARPLIPYLRALGVMHVYSSPLLKSRPGSTHGYDITDHSQLDPEIGSEAEFRAFVADLHREGMGLLLDTVPNHMGVGYGTNPWWQDVLENGPASEYANFFDIDWAPLKNELFGKVLIPILGDRYGEDLERGHLQLRFEHGGFSCAYYDKRLPLDPQSYPLIFEQLGDLRTRWAAGEQENADMEGLEGILGAFAALPPHSADDAEDLHRRQAEIPRLKQRLAALARRSPAVRQVIAEALERTNGVPGDRGSFDALHRVLEAQAYRLAHWQVSGEEINYRRFFDINDLVGLRMENPKVFAATHRLIRRLLAEGSVDGLRLDHPDGLYNPIQYFGRLQMLYAASQCRGPEPSLPTAENGIEADVLALFNQHDWINQRPPLYVLVEKVLEPGEELPQEWPVEGTVGYDFANLVNGLLIDGSSRRAFTLLYHRFIGGVVDVDEVVYSARKTIMKVSLASEVTVLTHLLDEIASTDRQARDFTRHALFEAIRETIACFPIYRTYIDQRGHISPSDRRYVEQAIALAKRRNESMAAKIFDFLRDVLLLKRGDTYLNHRRRIRFALKFQQLTGPVMAKGLEDTACYVYNRFVSVNEVGGSPREFGVPVSEFHRGNQQRAREWPNSMLTTSTHDTKRSEDVRARLNVLSEMPKVWAAQVMRWRRLNRGKKRAISDGRAVPDNNEEYLLYQTLAGAWPLAPHSETSSQPLQDFTRRIQQYMTKAVHEAKVNLSWTNQNPEYVAALEQFIARILQPGSAGRPNLFLQSIEAFLPPMQFFGCLNSLAQTLLKLTCPGVPDVYQGNELWDFSLVDPDNRRPVDFDLRQRLLGDLLASQGGDLPALCGDLLVNYADGRIKLWTTMRALQFRREHGALFQLGGYRALAGAGEKAQHLVAFAREHEWDSAIVAVPRLSYKLCGGRGDPPLARHWGETQLPVPPGLPGDFINVFTGERLRAEKGALWCRELFAQFPVALLSGA
jgi:(1->4)-alpha-D-glucan 1-alpha-D-glucosylmutase